MTEDVPVLNYVTLLHRYAVMWLENNGSFFSLWYVKRDRTRKHRCFINTRLFFTVCSDHLTKPESFLNSSIISWLPQHLFTPLQRLQWFSPFSVMMFEKTGTCVGTLCCAVRPLQTFSFGLVTLVLDRWAGVKTANNIFFSFYKCWILELTYNNQVPLKDRLIC